MISPPDNNFRSVRVDGAPIGRLSLKATGIGWIHLKLCWKETASGITLGQSTHQTKVGLVVCALTELTLTLMPLTHPTRPFLEVSCSALKEL